MEMNLKPSFKTLVGILFGMLIIGEVFLGILTYQAQLKAGLTLSRLKHSYTVVEQLDAISLLYSEVFPGITSDLEAEDFLDSVPSVSDREAIWTRLNKIRTLVTDNPEQLKRTERLEDMIEEQFSVADSIQMQANSSLSAISPGIFSSLVISTGIGDLVSDMKLEERHLMRLREASNQKSMSAFSTTFYLLLVGMGLVVVVTFVSIKLVFERGVRLRQKMKKIGELYEKFFYDSPVGMIIVRKSDGLVIDSNKAYSELLNCTVEEIVNKPPAILDSAVEIERYKSQFTSRPSLGKVMAIELQVKPKDRAPVFTSVSIQPISVKEEPCLLLAIHDMSLYKKAEEDMRRALAAEIDLKKRKTDFITLASHEFRTPLSTILSSAFLIENYNSPDSHEMLEKHLRRIRSAVSTMAFLVEEFISLTGIENERIIVKSDQVDIKEHMEKLLKCFDPFLKNGQQILYEHEGDTLVYTDPVLVGNMINILVSNSVKFSKDNSPILILTKVRNGFYIKVKDFGLGIPQEDQHRVFQRFFKASNADHIQGLGLGLHIMKHYVEMLQGEVRIKSKPKVGTEVIIAFKKKLVTESK